MGPLISAFGQTGPRALRLNLESQVCDAAHDGNWSLPHARSDEAETLLIVLTTIPPPSPARGPDKFLWRNGVGHFVQKFSAKTTWHSVREPAPVVPWHSLVWFKEGVPRYSFVTWMVALSRLPTRDRLNAWGINVPLHCALCSSGLESHQHLFFHCPLVVALWSHYCWNYGLTVPTSLEDVAGFLSRPLVAATPGLKLLLQAIIYCIWMERNKSIFQQVSVSEDGVKAHVHRLLRHRLLTIQPPSPSASLMQVYLSLLPAGL